MPLLHILATNIGTAFMVTAADESFDAARLEQMLVMAHESGARPVVPLNKIDLCDDLDARLADSTRVPCVRPTSVSWLKPLVNLSLTAYPETPARTSKALVNTKARGICSIKSGGNGHASVTAGLGRDAAKELRN
jgi:RsgA GTPase